MEGRKTNFENTTHYYNSLVVYRGATRFLL
jgi:hypothetical protein